MEGLNVRQPKRKYSKSLTILALILFLVANSGAPLQTSQASDSTKELEKVTEASLELTSYLTLKPAATKPPVYAKSVLIMDRTSGEIIWSKNPDEVVPVASTTKMTTALVARQLLTTDEVVTIQKSAVLVPGSKINLLTNEKITVLDLLRGLLIQSGNDAAFALAEFYGNKHGGDYKLFVGKMNEFLLQHNLTDTTFTDPAGLDDEQGRSSARSLSHVARLLLNDPVLSEIVTIPETTVRSTDTTISHQLKNSNRLVLGDSGYYLPGTLGVKTGFTPLAGHCLVAAYQTSVGDVIGVVLNTNEYTITASAAEMKKLFLWTEANVIRQSY